MNRILKSILCATIMASLVGCNSSKEAKYKAGTYTAEASGHNSGVKVTAEFSANELKKVTIDASNETESIGGKAATELEKQLLKKQSAEIDGVSGATETSNAVKNAYKDILSQAQTTPETKENKALKDGQYTETVASFGVSGMMTGVVTIKDNKITDIEITEEHDSETAQWFNVAKDKLIPRILEAQSVGVDSITGATTSSGAIKNIVSRAIESAGGDVSDWSKASEKKTDTKKLEGYDVIVVGLGGSGVLSYASAAKSGAKVFGIEAAGEIGGNSASVYGPMALNSKNLKDKYNNGQDYINADDVYNTWIKYVGTEEKADVIKEAVYNSGSALDYYMDNFDFSFGGMNGLLGSFVVPEWTKEWTVYTADNKKWYKFGPDHTY